MTRPLECIAPGLVADLLANQRERPFGRRVVVVPHVEDEGLLRPLLTRAAGQHGAPLVGTIFRTPEQLGAVLRPSEHAAPLSAHALRIELLSALQACERPLCGGGMPQAWRLQHPLALALAEDGLGALPLGLIAETFAGDPAFAEFLSFVHKWLSDLEGCAPWDTASQVLECDDTWVRTTGRLGPRSTPIDDLLKRLGAADSAPPNKIDVGSVIAIGNSPASARWVAESVAQEPGQRTAVILLEPSIEPLLLRSLRDCGVRSTASPRPATFPTLLTELHRLQRSDSAPLLVARLWREMPHTAAQFPELEERWQVFGGLELSPRAFASEVERDLRRYLTEPTRPADVHLFSPGRLPVLHYDRVLLVGAEQGNPAIPSLPGGALLTPRRAALLAQAGLAGFRNERTRQQLALEQLGAWCSAANEVVAIRRTVDGSGRAMPAASWLPHNTRQDAEAPPHRHTGHRLAGAAPSRHQLPLPEDWNPTRLRRVLQCPQQSLLQDVVGLRQTPDAVIDRLGSGSLWGILVHDLIEAACRRNPNVPLDALDDEAESLVRRKGAELPRAVQADLARELTQAAAPLLHRLQVEGVSIDAVEQQLSGTLAGRSLRARCDLMVRDADQRHFAVDVKTGTPKTPYDLQKDVAKGRELQRAFYRHLAPQTDDAWLLYSRSPAHPRATKSDLESVRTALQTFVTMGDEVWLEGAFAPAPDSAHACTYCPVRAACRADDPDWRDAFDKLAGPAETTRAETSGRGRS